MKFTFTNIQKIILLFVAFVLINLNSFAQKGYVFQSRGVLANTDLSTDYVQPDGSKVTIHMNGDAVVNWATTSDGYTLLMNQNNGFEYAVKDENGDLKLSGILAKNISDRKKTDNDFLKEIETNLLFSETQIEQKIETHQFLSKKKGELNKAFPTTGTQDLLLILANFSNTSTTYTQTQFSNIMNQLNYNGTGSFKDYYLENSYNQLTVVTTVTAWITLPNTHNYYGPEANWGEFAYDAIDVADAIVNYSNFDNDGDGFVEGVAIIHQGSGQEETGSTNDIWSHSWDLESAGYSQSARTFDGVVLSAYTTMPEISDGAIMTIGVMCHEFGHNLGSPDFYDTDYSGNDGTGDWDMMASGSYNGSPSGSSPAHHNAFTKWYYYGWYTPVELTAQQIVTMSNIEENKVAYYYSTTTANEYFLLENRQQVGFDEGLPGHGLIIYHVDQNYIVNHEYNNDINVGTHQGLYPKASNGTINSAGCAFPAGGDTQFNDTSNPNSKSWAGANTSKPLTSIAEASGVITYCYISCAAPCTPPTTQASSFSATNLADNSMTVNWNRGNGTSVLVVAHKSAAVDSDPVSGTSYTANAAFGTGTQIGTANYVVYKGTGTTVNVTGLISGTTYHYAIYEFFTADNCYHLTQLTGNATTTGTPPVTYCTLTSTNSTYEYISNVTLGSINNSTGSSMYTDYTAQTTSMQIGNSYPISITITKSYSSDNVYTWVDWNKDGDFSDANETISLTYTASGSGGTSTFSATANILTPGTASTGTTRMRVTVVDGTTTSCGTFQYGEVEDYSINILAATTPPVANFSANNTTPAIGETVTFTDLSANTPTSWAWSFSPTDVTYTGGTNASSQNPQVQFGTATSYTVTLVATNNYGNDTETKTAYINICSLGNIVTSGTWTEQATAFTTASRGIQNISIIDANNVWALAYDGSGGTTIREFTKTTNGGTTWTPGTITGYNTYAPSMLFGKSSTTAYIAMYESDGAGGVIIKTTNGGTSWTTSRTFNTAGFPNVVCFFDTNNGFAMGDPVSSEFEIYTTANDGTGWTQVAGANIPNPVSGEYGIVGLYEVYGNNAWFTTNKGNVYKTADKGLTWSKYSILTTSYDTNIDISMTDANNGVAHVGLYNGTTLIEYQFYKTTDGGATWTQVTRTGTVYNADVCNVPGTCDSYVSTGSDGTNGVSFSIDGGTAWTNLSAPQSSGSNVQLTAVEFLNSSLGWAGQFNTSATVGGIYKYSAAPVATVSAAPGCGAGSGSVTVTSSITGSQTFYLCNSTGTEISNFTTNASSYTFTSLANGTYTGKVTYNSSTSALSSPVTLTNATTPVAPTSVTSVVPGTYAIETTICEGESLSLEYSGGSGSTFNWYSSSCGTGLIGSSQNYIVTPSSTTTYYGRWENSCGVSTCASVTITVNQLPDAPTSVNASDTEICSGTSTTLSYSGGLGDTFIWYSSSCGSGYVNTGNNLEVIPSTTTTYYGLWENTCGVSTCASVQVVVNQLPTASVSGSTSICPGENTDVTIDFTGTSPWDFTYTDGTNNYNVTDISENPYLLNVINSGTYSITALNDANCTGNSFTGNATITENTLPTAVISGGETICEGETSELSVSFTGEAPFSITYSDGYSSFDFSNISENPFSFIVDTEGTYTLVSVSDVNCTGTDLTGSAVIIVEEGPVGGDAITEENSVCSGNSTIINLDNYSGNIQWQISTNNIDWSDISGETNSTLTTENLTVTTYYRAILSNSVCEDAISSVATVQVVGGMPGTAGTITGTAEVCAGDTEILYQVNEITDAIDYIWSLPFGVYITNGDNTNQITVGFNENATSGNITVYGSNGCGDGSSSPIFSVTVNNLPAAAGEISGLTSVNQGDISITYSIADIADADTYNWLLDASWNLAHNNGNSALIDFPIDAVSGVLEVYGQNQCGDGVSSTLDITVIVTDIENLSNYGINIYPNPSTGIFNIKLSNNENSEYKVVILDLTGKVIQETKDGKINITENPSGMYIIQIYVNGKVINSQIIKE